ncbi:MAG: hypothetical protein WKF81_00595 [Thermomicrobiales bacterium]
MSTLLALLLSLFVAFFLIFGTAVEPTARPTVATVEAMEALAIEDEPIERLALPTGDYSNAYVASSESLFEQNSSSAWIRIADAPPVGEIIFDGADPDVILVGDEGDCFRGGGGAAFQSSIDGGQSWTEATGDSQFIRPLAVWSESDLIVGAGCEGLLVSRDLGESWTIVADDLLGLSVTGFATIENREQTVLAGLTGEGGTSRLYELDLSESGETTVEEPLLEYYGIGALAGYEDRIFVGSITGVSSSFDGGETWVVDRAGLEDVTLERDPLVDGLPADLDPSNYGLYALALDEGNPLLVSSATSLFEHWSTDIRPADMPMWEDLGSVGSTIRAFVALPQESSVLAQADGMVFPIVPESVDS